jgi:hypothetical protein
MKRRNAQPEAALQKSVADLLNLHGWCWQHVPGEAHLHGDKEQRARQMKRMKAQGFRPGMPDVMVFERYDTRAHCTLNSTADRIGYGVAIELKAGRRKASDAQKQWMADLEDRGWLVAVCRTIDEVIDVLRHVRPLNGRRMGG